MEELFLLSDDQMRRIASCFPRSRGIPRLDDRHLLSGIIWVLRSGAFWCDAPKEYGLPKTIYNRFVRWGQQGVLDQIFAELSRDADKSDAWWIDATHLATHPSALILLREGRFPQVPGIADWVASNGGPPRLGH